MGRVAKSTSRGPRTAWGAQPAEVSSVVLRSTSGRSNGLPFW
jgi:hypothetical protein